MKRARRRALGAVFGLLLPIGTLAFGWSWAAMRETRFKEEVLDERLRPAVEAHFRWEMAGLGGSLRCFVVAGALAFRAFQRGRAERRARAMPPPPPPPPHTHTHTPFVTAVSH